MKRFRALMIVAACALTGVALPVLAGGFGDGFGGGAGAGVAYLATQFCALTGCTMTGQQVFSGVTTDISTGTNQDLTITPNGAGIVDISSALRASSALDVRGNISNGGSGTCFTGITGVPCFTENPTVTTGGNSDVAVRAGTTASAAGLLSYNSSDATVGGVRYFGTTSAIGANGQNKMTMFAQGTGASILLGHSTSDVAAGSQLVGIYDGSNFANLLAAFDGAGNFQLAAGATRSKGTITMAAGTGTATVASGSVCTCSDTTATNAVRCAVSSTTLTATGTGADVIAYICL